MICISEEMRNFRHALVAVLPMVEKAGIPWQEGASYDDWDRIAQALFQSFVIDVLLNKYPSISMPLPDYDMAYDDYSSLSPIFVRHAVSMEVSIFVAYSTSKYPFDLIRVSHNKPMNVPAGVCNECDVEYFISPQSQGHPQSR